MKKCPFCGADLKDDSLFCTECGKRIDEVTAHNEVVKGESENISQMKVYTAIILGMAFIIGFFFLISYDFSSKDSNSSSKVSSAKIVEGKSEYIESTSSSPSNNAQDEYYTENSSVHSSSSSTSLLTSFLGAENVVGVLANHTFTCGSGPEIRFDGDGIIYIENEAAGVVSVLRYSRKSVLLRYGSGTYGEGKIVVTIEDDGRMKLIDPVDGSTWYQKR